MSSRLRAGSALIAAIVLATGSVSTSAQPARAIDDPIALAPGILAYGAVTLGGAAGLTVTATNNGGAALDAGPVAISGAAAADFMITADTCSGAELAPAATCSVTVLFAPLAAGPRLATLSLPISDLLGTRTVSLTGTGADPVTVAASLSFGATPVTGATVTRTASLAATGASVSPASVAISGTNAADFTIVSDGCTGTLVADGSACGVDITFNPKAAGTRRASLAITGPSPLGMRTVALTGYGQPTSPVSWKTTSLAGPAYTWTTGGALGRSTRSGAQRLHLVFATDRVGGHWADNAGPYLGVAYTRSGTGSTWTTAKRLNSVSQHGDRAAVAAAGSRVYAAWVSRTRYPDFVATDPRVLYVRVNTGYGDAARWRTPVKLSGSAGRVDYPTVAASGSSAYIAWTDADTGEIRITQSHNGGSTWRTTTLGTTTWSSAEGLEGVPYVSASGGMIVVAWAADADNAVKARVSADAGAHWTAEVTLATTSTSTVSAAARGSRVAVAWTSAEGVVVAVRSGGAWGPARLVAPAAGDQYGPAIALQDTSRVGVAWAQDEAGLTRLRWAESPNNGTRWYSPTTIGAPTASREQNEWPSVQWPSAGARIVLWNGWTSGGVYRQYIRTGTGRPTGTPSVAPAPAAIGRETVEPGAGVHRVSVAHGS